MDKVMYTSDIEARCAVRKGCDHGPAPIPEEGKWVAVKEITQVSGLSLGIGWCAPQQGACKLTLNVKNGIIEEALIEGLSQNQEFFTLLLEHEDIKKEILGIFLSEIYRSLKNDSEIISSNVKYYLSTLRQPNELYKLETTQGISKWFKYVHKEWVQCDGKELDFAFSLGSAHEITEKEANDLIIGKMIL